MRAASFVYPITLWYLNLTSVRLVYGTSIGSTTFWRHLPSHLLVIDLSPSAPGLSTLEVLLFDDAILIGANTYQAVYGTANRNSRIDGCDHDADPSQTLCHSGIDKSLFAGLRVIELRVEASHTSGCSSGERHRCCKLSSSKSKLLTACLVRPSVRNVRGCARDYV